MRREEYNNCMKPFIRGKDKTKEERQQSFCIGAKICSGKAKTEAEAKQICLTQPPKPPREKKAGGKRSPRVNCGQEMATLAGCAAKEISISVLTTENFALTLAMALQKCGCGESRV